MTANIVKNNGVLALYNGLSAALLRQGTYSMARFAIYESSKKALVSDTEKQLPFWKKVALAGFSGAAGGLFGTPADVVNVRMQNDTKLPPELRRNYKHCFDGLYRIVREEGPTRLFSGLTMTVVRGCCITIGQ
jgi:dicarboxylate transporter 10